MSRIIVIALGQKMRGDDAAGLIAVKRWQAEHPSSANHPFIDIEMSGMPGLELLHILENSTSALIVDAVQSNSSPGEVHVLDESKALAFETGSKSAHGWGVAESLALGRRLGMSLPAAITIIGIEAEQVKMGAALSPAVESIIPKVVSRIENWVKIQLESAEGSKGIQESKN